MSSLQPPQKPIILGSTSKWRARVLNDAGIPFSVLSPDFDEKSIRNDNPYALTLSLAEAKAKAIVGKVEGEALLITADQVAMFRGSIREKPRDAAQARRWLLEYRNDCVHVVTTVVVTNVAASHHIHGHDTVAVEFEAFPVEIISTLIAQGDILYSCGGFVHEDPLIAPYVLCHRPRDESAAVSLARTRKRGSSSKDVLDSVSGLPLNLTKRLLARYGWEK